ncbi:MAG TPA: peptidylprolyl isomerase [Vicinamibacterales bacterium]|nr:peptidylprolyl isomerase [Vicinamibacterales bacterium]
MRPLIVALALVTSATTSAERRESRSARLSAERGGSPERLALLERSAPERYSVRLDTTKGAIVIAVHRDWAPRGAERFHELVTSRYFDDSRFFRVVKGQWAQFGIAADPKVATAWRTRTLPDDPRGQSNTRGRVAFAFAVPDGRTTQVYISLRDNSYQDEQGFVPFGEVAQGMDVADALNSEYGETAGGGIRAGRQQPLFDGGNAFLDREFPRLDRLLRARVLP